MALARYEQSIRFSILESVSITPQVSATVIDALGLLLTAWRIYFRLRINRFWWEDAWAAVLLLTGIMWIITNWVYLLTDGLTSIVASWIYSICFTSIVTLARMSILFSIIRIIYLNPRLRAFTYTCVAFFVACWVVLVVQKVWQCASDASWHETTPSSPNPICLVEKQISIFQFTTDCIAVSVLVVLPLRMLWRVKLPRRQRRMILSIFTSSVILAFAALFHTIGQILDHFFMMTVGFYVVAALSIIVCNLLVVVTYTCRFLLHDKAVASETTLGTTKEAWSIDDDDFTTSMSLAQVTTSLTTIDLEASLTSSGRQSLSRLEGDL
ncbi:hypothetical protein HD554DRAFT_2289948 [Boletus coccyginus]|nr:hypothetical protein HD554DRAFT_2289948 [Boletus coccyginus]